MSASTVVKFKTRSGSLYSYATDTKEWSRLEVTKESGDIRTNSGICLIEPTIALYESAYFIMNPLVPGTSTRMIITSPVVEILSGDSSGI